MRLEHANRLVYTRWLEEVDALFGFNREATRMRAAGLDDFPACCRNYELADTA